MTTKKESHCAICLEAHRRNPQGLADFEVAELTDISPWSCPWHRCSDLRKGGYIEWKLLDNGRIETRVNPRTDMPQGVSIITEKGKTQTWEPIGPRRARSTDPGTSHEAGAS